MNTELQDLYARRNALIQCLHRHDYIGVKIAMGRATTDDYADEIADSEAWATELGDINQQIADLEAAEGSDTE